MSQLLESLVGQIRPITLVDIGITAFVIYWLFRLIRGTRAVRLVIGVSVILVIYAVAQAVGLRLSIAEAPQMRSRRKKTAERSKAA